MSLEGYEKLWLQRGRKVRHHHEPGKEWCTSLCRPYPEAEADAEADADAYQENVGSLR
jgi:hypothetical protein